MTSKSGIELYIADKVIIASNLIAFAIGKLMNEMLGWESSISMNS